MQIRYGHDHIIENRIKNVFSMILQNVLKNEFKRILQANKQFYYKKLGLRL